MTMCAAKVDGWGRRVLDVAGDHDFLQLADAADPRLFVGAASGVETDVSVELSAKGYGKANGSRMCAGRR